MGLGDLDPSNKNELVRDQMKSESDDERYPQFQERVPYIAIWKDDSGEYHAAPSPHSHTVQYIKESKSKAWRPRMVPDEIERYWMDQYEFKRVRSMVDEVLGLDLMELLQDDPESALKAVILSAKHHNVDRSPSVHRRCGVCDEELHIVMDTFEEIGTRIVCSDHTVSEITKAGLL